MKDLRARIATGDLLVTKWQAPQLPTSYVHRPRLLEQMHQAVTRQLALLSAPAGFGKTMLLAEWSASSARPVAWLSLEPADNDPARFLLYLLATFQQIHPQIGETAAQQLDARHQPAQEAILTSIVNDLAANLSTDLILILDAYQVITHEAIHQIMTFVLEHLPPQVHLVIGTRMDPPWPLARWRAQGRLSELQSSDLRFSTAEVMAFLRLMHLDLSEQMQYQIAQRTEGWIAAVQLAALDAQHEQAVAAALLPSVRPQRRNALVAYLSEEILAQQPQALQDFLVQTSILTRLNGSLCDAVTGRQDSQAMLERLGQSSLFTEALDHEGGWYRYHPLFAEALRFHLGRSHPELVAVLHQRASHWYEQHGVIEEAIDHALLAHEEARAATLLETTTSVCFAQGRYATLLRWLEQLPMSLLLAHPHLGIIYAWMLVCDERIEQAHAMAHMVERHLGELRGGGQDASSEEAVQTPGMSLAPAVIWEEVRRELTLLSATLALLQGEHARALALVHEILRTGKSDSPLLRHFAELHLGLIARLQGDLAGAEVVLRKACAPDPAEGLHFGHLAALTELVSLYEARGDLWKIARLYQEARRLLIRRGEARSSLMGWMAVGMSKLLQERNDLSQAAIYAQEALTLGQQTNQEELILTSMLTLATIAWAQGRREDLKTWLHAFELFLEEHAFPASVRASIAASRARLELASGKIEFALDWAQQRGLYPPEEAGRTLDGAWCDDPLARDALVLVRLLIAEARCHRSGNHLPYVFIVLDRVRKLAEQTNLTGRVIETLVLQALALQVQGRIGEAAATLKQAVQLSEPRGYVRLFADEGAPMASLLAKVQAQRQDTSGYLHTLLQASLTGLEPERLSSALVPTEPRQVLPAALVPLSSRELEVLRLLATGASNQEIAAHLVITLETVKRHVRHILAKLAVTNRTQAVVRARDFQLL